MNVQAYLYVAYDFTGSTDPDRVIEEIVGKPSCSSGLGLGHSRDVELSVNRMSLEELSILKRKIKAALPGHDIDVAYDEWDADEDAEALASLEV